MGTCNPVRFTKSSINGEVALARRVSQHAVLPRSSRARCQQSQHYIHNPISCPSQSLRVCGLIMSAYQRRLAFSGAGSDRRKERAGCGRGLRLKVLEPCMPRRRASQVCERGEDWVFGSEISRVSRRRSSLARRLWEPSSPSDIQRIETRRSK